MSRGSLPTRLFRDDRSTAQARDFVVSLSQMGDATGNTGYAWDAAGRQTAVQYPTGLNLTYGYDPAGNRTTLQDKTGTTSYGYDSEHRVTGIENPYGERTTVVWDALGREQHKTLGNGMTVSHGYDPAGREWLIENRKASGEAVGVFTGTFDAAGNRLTGLELDGTKVTYGYDPSDQLVYEARDGASGYFASYSYDGVGNRLQKLEAGGLTAYQYNIADELLLATPPTGAPTTSTWDRMGNLETETTGSAVTTYSWDTENRLVRVLSPTEDEVYRYAGDGKRRSKESSGATTLFTWDGENLLLETDAALAPVAKYTDWPGYWGGLASQRRGSDSSFYGFDLQWSTRVLVSIAGAVTDSYAYRAFGEEVAQSGATVNPFRYVGQPGYLKTSLGLSLVRARAIAAIRTIWISRDPAGVRRWSPYAVSENSPINRSDPDGMQAHRGGRGGRPTAAQCNASIDPATNCYSIPHCCGHNSISQAVVQGLFEFALEPFGNCIHPAPSIGSPPIHSAELLDVLAKVLTCTALQESSLDPHCRASVGVVGTPFGLTQLGADEWRRCGAGGRICDPWDNIRARVNKTLGYCLSRGLGDALDDTLGAYGANVRQFTQCLSGYGLDFSFVHPLLTQVVCCGCKVPPGCRE